MGERSKGSCVVSCYGALCARVLREYMAVVVP